MKRALTYILVRTLFGLALYFGLVVGIEGAARVAMFYAWLSAIVAWTLLSPDQMAVAKKRGPPLLPGWFRGSVEAVLVLTMIWHGWAVTSVAYAIGALLVGFAFRKPEERAA